MSVKHISSGRINKRRAPNYVPTSAKNVAATSPRRPSTINTLTAEFDALLARMQSSRVRSNTKAAFNASPSEITRGLNVAIPRT